MSNLKDKLELLPKKPGVYLFKNNTGEVIYVGKAKNLKSRVSQYFGKSDSRPQLPFLMQDAVDLDFTVVDTELDSLFLENSLIKQYLPQYNIKLRDDKNYAFISIDYNFEIPKISYARKVENQNNKIHFFGPYSSAKKIKITLDLIRKIFPYCSNTEVGKRPCFYYHLHRCPGVCTGQISLDEYKQQLKQIEMFINGREFEILKAIKTKMKIASRKKQFEMAAKFRDQLKALELLNEKQLTILPKKVSWDLISLFISGPNASVNLFKVRDGKLIDKENFIYDATVLKNQNNQQKVIIQKFLEDYYSVATNIPKELFVEVEPENSNLAKALIENVTKKTVKISAPSRGAKQKLIKLGKVNAEQYLQKWMGGEAKNIDSLMQALTNLQTILKLPNIPKRIEGYDISNTQGTNPVGSMVVIHDGQVAKSEYRKFKITGKSTPDDFAMMEEMLTRRLGRISPLPTVILNEVKDLDSSDAPQNDITKKQLPKQAWPTPDLLVIDGGKGQLAVAARVLKQFKLKIPVIGLAKRIEEIFLPNKSKPIILSHDNPSLQMLQRLRDEAHRFGITFHRSLRSKQAVKSELDSISGVGPKTKKLLKQHFGTVSMIKKASIEELAKIIGKSKAEQIKKSL